MHDSPNHRPDLAQHDPVVSRVPDTDRSGAPVPVPYRVLAIGGPILTGDASGGRALSSAVALELSSATGHEVVIESVVCAGATVDELSRSLTGRDLGDIDAVVLALDRCGSPAQHRTGLAAQVHDLVDDLWHRLVPGSGITVVVFSTSITGRGSKETAAFADAVGSQVNALVRVVRLLDEAGDESLASMRSRWGARIAAAVAGGLLDPLAASPDHRLRPVPPSRLPSWGPTWSAPGAA